VQRGLPDEIFLAYHALERLAFLVREHVSPENRPIVERLITVFAFVGTVARVNQLVAFKATPILEFSVTLATFETVFWVPRTPQDMLVVEILSRKHSTAHLAFESALCAM